MQSIRQGDTVVITAGRSRGHKGTVLEVLREEKRVVVEGGNLLTRHQKSTERNPGGKFQKEAPIDISNVKLIDPTGVSTRVGVSEEKGKRVRISKKTGKVIPHSFRTTS